VQVQNRVEVYFVAIEIVGQQVFGEPGDQLDSVVHFALRYPDGRLETNLTANIWHAVEPVSSGAVEVTLPASFRCPAYQRSLERALEEYYRRRVGVDGTVIRVGKKGVSALLIGIPMESAASAEFEVEPLNAA
jgi:hypothetical protein